MKYEINITQRDIKLGGRWNAKNCPVARAIRRVVSNFDSCYHNVMQLTGASYRPPHYRRSGFQEPQEGDPDCPLSSCSAAQQSARSFTPLDELFDYWSEARMQQRRMHRALLRVECDRLPLQVHVVQQMHPRLK